MRRIAFGVLIVSIAASAVLGSWAILDMGEDALRGDALSTALVFSVAGLFVMSCGRAWGRRRLRPLAVLGMLLTLAAAAVLTAIIWREGRAEDVEDVAGSLCILAASATLACLLAVVPLSGGARVVRIATLSLGVAWAAGALYLVWADPFNPHGPWVGVGAVLLSAGTALVVVLQRQAETRVRASQGVVTHCPACGAAADSSGCVACGARYRVEFLP